MKKLATTICLVLVMAFVMSSETAHGQPLIQQDTEATAAAAASSTNNLWGGGQGGGGGYAKVWTLVAPTEISNFKNRKSTLGVMTPGFALPSWPDGDGVMYNAVVDPRGINFERAWWREDIESGLRDIGHKGPVESIFSPLFAKNWAEKLTMGKGFKIINHFSERILRKVDPDDPSKLNPLYIAIGYETDINGNVKEVDPRLLREEGHVLVGTSNVEGLTKQNFHQVAHCAIAQGLPYDIKWGIFRGMMKRVTTGATKADALGGGHATTNITVSLMGATTDSTSETYGKGTYIIEWYAYDPDEANRIKIPKSLLDSIIVTKYPRGQIIQTAPLSSEEAKEESEKKAQQKIIMTDPNPISDLSPGVFNAIESPGVFEKADS